MSNHDVDMTAQTFANKAKTFISIALPILTFLLGSGVVWKCENSKIEKARQLSSLREKLTDRFFKQAQLNQEYFGLLKEFAEYEHTNKKKSGELKYSIDLNLSKSSILSDEVNKLENEIAKLENREPRNLNTRLPDLRPIFPPRLKGVTGAKRVE